MGSAFSYQDCLQEDQTNQTQLLSDGSSIGYLIISLDYLIFPNLSSPVHVLANQRSHIFGRKSTRYLLPHPIILSLLSFLFSPFAVVSVKATPFGITH